MSDFFAGHEGVGVGGGGLEASGPGQTGLADRESTEDRGPETHPFRKQGPLRKGTKTRGAVTTLERVLVQIKGFMTSWKSRAKNGPFTKNHFPCFKRRQL